MLRGKIAVEEGEQLADLIGKIVEYLGVAVALERQRLHGAAAGSAADAEIDSPGVERVERAKDLRHLERSVVRQHDAAGAEANLLRLRADAGEQDLGSGTGEGVHGMMLGHPEPLITEDIHLARQLD